MTTRNAKGPAEGATSPDHGSIIPQKDMKMNNDNTITAMPKINRRSFLGADARPIHPALVKAAIAANAAEAEVKAAANYLAETMQRIHGGSWRIQIEHENEFVMVARRLPKGRATPKREVA